MFIEFGLSQDLTFFQDDIKNDNELMKILKSLRVEWEVFQKLRNEYLRGKNKERKSLLSEKMTTIQELIQSLVELLKHCATLNPPKHASAIILSETFLKRSHCIKDIIIACGKLNAEITDNFVIKSFKHHIGQQKETLSSECKIDEDHDIGFSCLNDTSLSWTKVSEILIEEELLCNKGELTSAQLQEAVEIISSNIVTTVCDLNFPCSQTSIDQLIKLLPVMLITNNQGSFFINLHEFVYSPGSLELLLSDEGNCEIQENVVSDANENNSNDVAGEPASLK